MEIIVSVKWEQAEEEGKKTESFLYFVVVAVVVLL